MGDTIRVSLTNGRYQFLKVKTVSKGEVIDKIKRLLYLEGIGKIISLFKASLANNILIFDDVIGKDIQGYGSRTWGIGLYKGIADNPFAWVHEVLEYLGDVGKIRLEVKGNYVYLYDDKGSQIFILSIMPEIDRTWIAKARRGNRHYGFRIIQRILAKKAREIGLLKGQTINQDELLSAKIRLNKVLSDVGKKYGEGVRKVVAKLMGEDVVEKVNLIDKESLISALEDVKAKINDKDLSLISYLMGGIDCRYR